MYLFGRRGRLSGSNLREALGWATSITERVSQATGLQIRLSTVVFSPEVGTLLWSATVPDLTALEAATDKLAVDDAYNDLAERGTAFVIPGSLTDSLLTVIHGNQPDPNRQTEYVSVVRSTAVAGHLARGFALGVEIAQKAEKVTGIPTGFLADATGNYGGVAWVSAFANIAEMERAQMALNTDQSFIEMIDKEAAGVYTDQPGATSQVILRRII